VLVDAALELGDEVLRLRLAERDGLDEENLTGIDARADRLAERELLHGLVRLLGIVAGMGSEDHAAAGPDGRGLVTGAGVAGALLAPRLLAGTGDRRLGLGRVGAGTA